MSKPVSSNNLQQGKTLLNPFEFSDDQILENVYKTHFHCVEKCDVGSLYSVASNVITHTIEITDTMIIKSGQHIDEVREDTSFTSFQRLTAKLKRIACQMICTARGENYAHQTTMLIPEQLRAYSWDAKAVIALAAFALEYGKFNYWESPRDQPTKSLAELNGLQSIKENTQHLVNFSSLVKKVMQVIECITEWKRLTGAGYDIKDVPALSDTLHEIPVIAYWAIFTFVTCTGQIDDFTSDNKGHRYELSKKFDSKLDLILNSFKDHLDQCSKQIGAIEDYTRRKTIVNRIEEFKKKYVLLFISGLDNIEEETQLLKSINERLKEEPKVVEGYRKEDFKILWISIVDDWNDKNKELFKEVTKIGWYVVKEFNFSTGIRLIKEVFNYKDKPIIPLISPEGKVENPDAKLIISVWGIDGFPFRSSDHIRLTQQWNWFWAEMINLSPRIRELVSTKYYKLMLFDIA